jgi:IS5 family transposase
MPVLIPFLILLLSGCTTPRHSADFSVAEARINEAIAVANPEAKKHLVVAKAQLETAVQACKQTSVDLDEAVKEKNEAIKDAGVWKAKQRKALKELWIYRGAIIALVLWTFRGVLFGGVMFVARKFVGIPW